MTFYIDGKLEAKAKQAYNQCYNKKDGTQIAPSLANVKNFQQALTIYQGIIDKITQRIDKPIVSLKDSRALRYELAYFTLEMLDIQLKVLANIEYLNAERQIVICDFTFSQIQANYQQVLQSIKRLEDEEVQTSIRITQLKDKYEIAERIKEIKCTSVEERIADTYAELAEANSKAKLFDKAISFYQQALRKADNITREKTLELHCSILFAFEQKEDLLQNKQAANELLAYMKKHQLSALSRDESVAIETRAKLADHRYSALKRLNLPPKKVAAAKVVLDELLLILETTDSRQGQNEDVEMIKPAEFSTKKRKRPSKTQDDGEVNDDGIANSSSAASSTSSNRAVRQKSGATTNLSLNKRIAKRLYRSTHLTPSSSSFSSTAEQKPEVQRPAAPHQTLAMGVPFGTQQLSLTETRELVGEKKQRTRRATSTNAQKKRHPLFAQRAQQRRRQGRSRRKGMSYSPRGRTGSLSRSSSSSSSSSSSMHAVRKQNFHQRAVSMHGQHPEKATVTPSGFVPLQMLIRDIRSPLPSCDSTARSRFFAGPSSITSTSSTTSKATTSRLSTDTTFSDGALIRRKRASLADKRKKMPHQNKTPEDVTTLVRAFFNCLEKQLQTVTLSREVLDKFFILNATVVIATYQALKDYLSKSQQVAISNNMYESLLFETLALHLLIGEKETTPSVRKGHQARVSAIENDIEKVRATKHTAETCVVSYEDKLNATRLKSAQGLTSHNALKKHLVKVLTDVVDELEALDSSSSVQYLLIEGFMKALAMKLSVSTLFKVPLKDNYKDADIAEGLWQSVTPSTHGCDNENTSIIQDGYFKEIQALAKKREYKKPISIVNEIWPLINKINQLPDSDDKNSLCREFEETVIGYLRQRNPKIPAYYELFDIARTTEIDFSI